MSKNKNKQVIVSEKKEVVQPDILVIDTPNTRTLVNKIAAETAAKSECEGEIEKCRNILEPYIIDKRNAAERGGTVTKHVQVVGSEANLKFTFPDAFAKIDPLAKGTLEEALGASLVAKLFVAGKSVKVKKGLEAKLLEVLGDMASNFLEVEEFIEPVEDFRIERGKMAQDLTVEQNRVLDEVVVQVQHRPRMSFK